MLTASRELRVVLMMYNGSKDELPLVAPASEFHFWSIGEEHVDPELAESVIKAELVAESIVASDNGIYYLNKKGRDVAAALRQFGFDTGE